MQCISGDTGKKGGRENEWQEKIKRDKEKIANV